jgi:hypothetical protein
VAAGHPRAHLLTGVQFFTVYHISLIFFKLYENKRKKTLTIAKKVCYLSKEDKFS